jgi:hypothetical protein
MRRSSRCCQNVELPENDPLLQPSVQAGIFGTASGTVLHMVDFADDPFSLSDSAVALYTHLTGDASLNGFVMGTDPNSEAVHDYQITDPERVRSFIDLTRSHAERSAQH